MTGRDRLGLAGLLAVLLASTAVLPIFDDRGWFLPAAGAAAAVAVAGGVSRRLRVPLLLQPVVGLAVLMVYVVLVFAGDTLKVILPTEETFSTLRELIDGGAQSVSEVLVPVPTDDQFVILAVLAIGAVAVAVETLAVTAGRALLAGAPLLLLFAGSAGIVERQASWWSFGLAVAGWLLLLLVEAGDQRSRWGAPLRSGRRNVGTTTGQGGPGSRIAVAAAGLALFVPLLLPSVGSGILDNGFGSGDGDGSRTVTTYNPITRLRGELSLPDPVTVLTYRTDTESPDYLRMTTLSVYDGNGWRQDTLNGNLREDGVGKPLSTPIGRSSGASTQTVSTTVTLRSLAAYWLPAPATPSAVRVDGPWLWDRISESIFSTRSNTKDVDTYQVTSREATPTASDLRAASTSLPQEIQPFAKAINATDRVKALTASVVSGQPTAYGKALALQAFFHANGFVYDNQTESGSSPDALQDFLEQRRGFCEQYASAMAAMLRLSGIPARVAVGFTPGQLQADGSYLVTTNEAHAWPEAWFTGVGWVRFEPTPSTGFTPTYAEPQTSTGTTTDPSASASATTGPNATTTPGQSRAEADAIREAEEAARAAGGSGDAGSGGVPVAPIAAGVLVLVLVGLPAALHRLRRRLRWARPSSAAAWDQLRDDAFDVGLPLDPARSLRQSRDVLIRQAVLTGDARLALGRLAAAAEHDRYAPSGTAALDRLAGDAALVRDALRGNLSAGRRLSLALLPPSTLRWTRETLAGRSERLGRRWEGLRSSIRLRPVTARRR